MLVTLTRKPLTVCGKSTRISATWRLPCGTIFPSGACSARSRRHASGTRIGLMDSTVLVEAMECGMM